MGKDELEDFLMTLPDHAEPHLVLLDDLGEGEVHVSEDFSALSSLQQADLLNDWKEKLEEMYNSVTSGTFLTDMGSGGINQPPASGALN